MAYLDASATQELLLEYVDKNVHSSFDEKAGLLGLLERQDPDPTNNIGIRVPVYVEPNSSEGWIAESGDYPAADSEVRIHLNVRYKRVFSVGRLTVDTKVHDEEGANTFVKPISASVKACLMSLKKKINGHLYEDGTGKIAVLSAAYSGGTPTVFTCGATRGDFGTQKLTKRKQVQMYDATATTLRNGTIGGDAAVLTVSSRSKSARTVTFTSNGPSDAIDTDIIVPSGSVNAVIKGLAHIVGTSGSYFGQSRSTYDGLRATDKAMSSASNSASAMDSLSNQMKYKAGVDEIMQTSHLWLMSPEQEQGYKNEGYELRTFPGSDASLSGPGLGFKRGKLSHSDEEFMVDIDCQDSIMYYVDPSVLKLAMLRKVSLFELHPGVMLEPATASSGQGYNSDFFYHMGGFFECFSPEPYRLGKLSGLAIPGSGGNF